MQVKLHTATTTAASTLPKQRGIEKPQRVRVQEGNQPVASFPDSPLISSRPLRYNVQLNQQLTSVQQADRYLIETERQLSHLYHLAKQHKGHDPVKQQANKLLSLLQHRTLFSGGTVDRQLTIQLERKPQIKFTFNDADNLLQSGAGETLIFSLAGTKSELTSVKLPEQSSSNQRLLQINKGLGRFGIHGQLEKNDQLVFRTDEDRWNRLNTHFSVRGEGHYYPKEQFTPIKLQPESTLEQGIQQITVKPSTAKNYFDEMKETLNLITRQLRILSTHKENVRSRIASMSTFNKSGSALAAADTLANQLNKQDINYSTLSQAINGQGNVRIATVKNLLSN